MAIKRFILPINASGTIQSLRTTNVTQTTIALAWDVYPGATAYQVRRNGTLIATPTGTTFSNSGHTASTQYTYAVRPVVGGSGVASAEASIVVTTQNAGETPFFTWDVETGSLPYSASGVTLTPNSGGLSVSTAYAYSGSRSVQFRFPASARYSDSSAELRISFGRGVRDIWVRYWLRVPENYYHRQDPNASSNNKGFLYLWSGDYGAPSSVAVGYNFWPLGNTDNPASYASIYVWGQGKDYHIWSAAPNAIEAADRGKWVKIVLHCRFATAPNNGVLEAWKTRDGVTQKITDRQNVDMYWSGADAHAGWTQGYLFGWANSGFDEQTDLYIDDITFSETPLS